MRRVWMGFLVCLLVLGLHRPVAAVTLPSECTATAGAIISATNWNTCITGVQTNLTTIQTGGLALSGQTIGDLLTATSTATFGRLAAVTAGQFLVSQGTGTAPTYSAGYVGPYGIGGATVAGAQLTIAGSFTGTGGFTSGLRLTHTLTGNANDVVYGQQNATTLTEAGSGVHALLAGLVIGPTFVGAGATTTDLASLLVAPMTADAGVTNASTVKITGAPTGATNNYALWVAAGNIRHAGYIGRLADTSVGPRVGFDQDAILSLVSGTSYIGFYSQNATSERMRLTDGGILALGTTVMTSSVGGDLVLGNGRSLRFVNAAGTDTIGVIRIVGVNDIITFSQTRAAAGTPGNFVANYYVLFHDNDGNNLYIPAMNAAW